MNKPNFCSLCHTFIFRKKWGRSFFTLSDEDAGKLIKQILKHANGEKVTLPENLDKIGEIMIADIESNCYKYLLCHQPNRVNAKMAEYFFSKDTGEEKQVEKTGEAGDGAES